MSKCRKYSLHLAILIIASIFIGCQNDTDSGKEKSPENQKSPAATDTKTPASPTGEAAPKAETNATPTETAEPLDLSQLPPLSPRPGSDAEKILADMVATYKNAKSYGDHGYVELKYELKNGQPQTEIRNCTFAFQKPNKVRMEVHRGQLVSDGTLFSAQSAGNSELYGQVIEKRAPAEISIKDLYGDYLLAGLMELGVPPEVLFVPPQIVLLFAKDPLQTLRPEGAEVMMGLPEYVLSRDKQGAFPCDKIEVVDKLTGRRTYWIEWGTNTLMRMEIAADRVRDSDVKPISFKIELQDATIDPDPDLESAAFMMQKPITSMTVEEFQLPELMVLGKVPDGTVCTDGKGEQIGLASPTYKGVNVAVLFVTDPQAEMCRPALQTLQRLSLMYADNPNVNCYPVSVDADTVSNDTIAQTLKGWEVGLPFLRQPEREVMTRLGLTDAPTFLIFGPNGTLQLIQSGLLPYDHLSQFVSSALAGNDPYKAILKIFDDQKTAYHELVGGFVSYDIFRTEPEHVQIAERTEPKTMTLAETWRRTEFASPGNPHVVGRSLLVPHDFQKISVLGSDGKTLVLNENNDPATITPEGIPADMPLHFIREAAAPDGQRYFAVTGINQQRLFVLDKDLNPVMTWPQTADVGKYEIAAVQMADLNGDDEPELVIGYRVPAENAQRLSVIDLKGKTVWEDRNVTEPDQIAIVLKNKVPHVWVVNRYNETNALVEFDAAGKKLREWHVDPVGGLIWKLFAGDLDKDGNTDVLAVLPRDGELIVAGVNPDARAGTDASQKPLLWEHAVSPGSHGVKSFEFVVPGDIDGDSFDEWCVAAADGTIYFFNKAGKPLDGFASGQLLSGMAVIPGTGEATLVLTTSKDRYDNAPAEDAVIAFKATRKDAAPKAPATEPPPETAAPVETPVSDGTASPAASETAETAAPVPDISRTAPPATSSPAPPPLPPVLSN